MSRPIDSLGNRRLRYRDNRQVARRVGAEDVAVEQPALAAEADDHGLVVADDVVVGHKRAVGADQEAGAGGVARADRDDGGAGSVVDRAGHGLALVRRERLRVNGRKRVRCLRGLLAAVIAAADQRAGEEAGGRDDRDDEGDCERRAPQQTAPVLLLLGGRGPGRGLGHGVLGRGAQRRALGESFVVFVRG
jgi:hypothetical protein